MFPFVGVPLGTRTPTNGFGDRYAAITSERHVDLLRRGLNGNNLPFKIVNLLRTCLNRCNYGCYCIKARCVIS